MVEYLDHRASLPPENAKTFNHGQDLSLVHQRRNIVLSLKDMFILLRPIPLHSQRYGGDHVLQYRTEA